MGAVFFPCTKYLIKRYLQVREEKQTGIDTVPILFCANGRVALALPAKMFRC